MNPRIRSLVPASPFAEPVKIAEAPQVFREFVAQLQKLDEKPRPGNGHSRSRNGHARRRRRRHA